MTTRSFRHLPNELVANLESAPYRYASTMAGIPHYYTLRKNWEDDEAFVWTVAEMRKHEVARPAYSVRESATKETGPIWSAGTKTATSACWSRQSSGPV